SKVATNARQVLAIGLAELVQQVGLLGSDRDPVHDRRRGSREAEDPDVVEQEPEQEKAEEDGGWRKPHGRPALRALYRRRHRQLRVSQAHFYSPNLARFDRPAAARRPRRWVAHKTDSRPPCRHGGSWATKNWARMNLD